MITRDIHSNRETVEQALYNLDIAIHDAKRTKDRILCVIVGYGSGGGTHKIRTAVIGKLDEYVTSGRVKAYLSGGDLDFGPKHLEFLKKAPAFSTVEKSANTGVIYVSV